MNVRAFFYFLFMLSIPCLGFTEADNLANLIIDKKALITNTNEIKRPKTGLLELTSTLNSIYVRISLEIKPDGYVSGYIYKNKNDGIYVYGRWLQDDWFYLYDQMGSQYQVLPNTASFRLIK